MIRVPLVAGLGRGAGTSTVAAALHANDGGPCNGAADVLVCSSHPESLRRAGAIAVAPSGPRPVLAVVLTREYPEVAPGSLRTLGLRLSAIVLLPHVARWSALAPPLDDAATVLGQPEEHLPRPLRAYAAGLRAITAAVVRSGQLTCGSPPMVVRPRSAELWRGLRPVERRAAQHPVLLTAAPARTRAPAPVHTFPTSTARDTTPRRAG